MLWLTPSWWSKDQGYDSSNVTLKATTMNWIPVSDSRLQPLQVEQDPLRVSIQHLRDQGDADCHI